ncbi:CAMK family protein kinase [Histomonas meleagridis]|uniref:CAMK family protein kinase n=1 Tax=Histomonas meleagridis TaxID=135588 RepID=UPI003559DA9B|nr:CAMK family protein kinase [Histomonas meleagridis]KAH0802710.1 CAMK family protein kinase [Histomonas meleagridis]
MHPQNPPEQVLFTVKDYEFIEMVGRGGFAEVYLVNDKRFGCPFVAKVMMTEGSQSEKWKAFDAEVNALSSLDHPNIIRLYDHFCIANKYYLILEYCPNGSLQAEINKTSGLSLDRFIFIGKLISNALLYSHNKGIAHNDIKPSNVLLDYANNPKVADFGLCMKTVNGQLCKSFAGSLAFTAPEIFQKKSHDPLKADCWSLGVTFAIMANGYSPWEYESLGGLKEKVSQGTIRLRKGLPEMVVDLIHRTITVDPSERLTMKEIVEHPLFQAPSIPRRIVWIRKLLEKPKWNTIQRISNGMTFDDSILNDYKLEYDNSNVKNTFVHSASSMFCHRSKAVKEVTQRFRVKSNHT